MNELFSQGGKGSTGILTNKQAVARHFGIKQSEVVYFSVGAVLSGYKVVYDKVTQQAYTLPADLGSGVIAISLSSSGVLVHSAGSVDLGALAVAREEYVTLPGSFSTGVTVNTKNELVVFTDGKYRWDGALPKIVPAGSTPTSSGGIGAGAWVGVGALTIRKYLLDTNAIFFARPEEYGGIGDGVADDTVAINAAIASGKPLSLAGKNWRITSTVNLPDGCSIDMRSSSIVADTGVNPLFHFEGKNLGLTIQAGGGVVTGTAGAFLECEGASDTPANGDYAKLIRLYGLHISSPTILYAIKFLKAVRQVFIDNCMFYTVNGIVSSGKTVEITCDKSIVFGSTNATNTVGIGIYSTGTGGPYYNEGWHFTDCTIDNFEKTFDVTDIFVLTVNGGFIGNNSNTGYSFHFAEGVTSHTREISIRSVIGGRVRFADSSSGKLYHANISGEITYCKGGSGTALAIGANCSGIDIRDVKFTNNVGHTLASVGNNAGNVHFSGISSDSSHTAGIIFNGEDGGNCSISDYVYAGTGEAMSLARAVKLSNVPASGATSLGWLAKYDYVSVSKDVAVGAYINQLQMTIARYSKIGININLSYSGGAASNAQTIGITVPTGVVLPNGSNSMQFTLPSNAGTLTMCIVATTTADFKNLSFSIDNRAGNQLRILAGSHLSVSLAN